MTVTVNRETSRDKLASLLDDYLVTTKKIVQEVFNRKVDDPEGQSPIVVVISAGTNRPANTFGGHGAEFHYEVQIWVLYADPTADPAWTESDAEDRLDLIEKEVGQVIENNPVIESYWDDIDYDGRSTVADVVLRSGVAYILERIPIKVETY